jgi:hypothetical protein
MKLLRMEALSHSPYKYKLISIWTLDFALCARIVTASLSRFVQSIFLLIWLLLLIWLSVASDFPIVSTTSCFENGNRDRCYGSAFAHCVSRTKITTNYVILLFQGYVPHIQTRTIYQSKLWSR